MKRILTILMFVAVLGMFISSVGAADLHPYDFDGKFTMDVPSDDFDRHPVGTNTFNDKSNNLCIEYFTISDVQNMNCKSFDEYINECMKLEKTGTDGNLTIFKDGKDNVVTLQSDDVLVIITDDNLEEAKAIAKSADFNNGDAVPSENKSAATSGNSSNSSSSSGDFERVKVNDYFTIEAPKGTVFDNGTYDGFWVTYYGSEFKGIVYYTNNDLARATLNDAYYDEFIKNITSHDGIKSNVEGNVTFVEGIQNIDGTNAGYVHGNDAIVIVISNDLNLVKKMAPSVEFTK